MSIEAKGTQGERISKLTPFAAKMLDALRRLTKDREAHPCGGFTCDDMLLQMGQPFADEETRHAAIDELVDAALIRSAGFDDEDATGVCYEFLPKVK
jgi:hypothetical protein